jgi:hypothetical protein
MLCTRIMRTQANAVGQSLQKTDHLWWTASMSKPFSEATTRTTDDTEFIFV